MNCPAIMTLSEGVKENAAEAVGMAKAKAYWLKNFSDDMNGFEADYKRAKVSFAKGAYRNCANGCKADIRGLTSYIRRIEKYGNSGSHGISAVAAKKTCEMKCKKFEALLAKATAAMSKSK